MTDVVELIERFTGQCKIIYMAISNEAEDLTEERRDSATELQTKPQNDDAAAAVKTLFEHMTKILSALGVSTEVPAEKDAIETEKEELENNDEQVRELTHELFNKMSSLEHSFANMGRLLWLEKTEEELNKMLR
ncbi:hypothetical protein HDU67_001842 [Dinochytrium kinnereticum]|nr:hypothetical protein HDU67_001842 [Dinochytrium kinnereticum]